MPLCLPPSSGLFAMFWDLWELTHLDMRMGSRWAINRPNESYVSIFLELACEKKFIPKISLKNLEKWIFRIKNKKIQKQTFEYLILKLHFSRYFNEILGMNFFSYYNSRKNTRKIIFRIFENK